MSVVVSTCTHPKNSELLEKWASLIPKGIPIDVTESVCSYPETYLPFLLKNDEDWVVHMDDDSFLMSFKHVEKLMKHMEDNDIDFCGMPDGGTVEVRWQNPIPMASCFIIFNMKNIRKKSEKLFNMSWEDIKKDIYRLFWADWDLSLIKHIPHHLQHCNNVQILPKSEFWYNFFYFLIPNFKYLYLDGMQWYMGDDKNSSIILSHIRTPLVIHTWYARRYREELNKKRIDAHFEIAKKYQEFDKENLRIENTGAGFIPAP